MKKIILAIGIVILFILSALAPMSIGYNVKTSNNEFYEDVTNDRIEDMYGLKYDNRGYIINNHLIREEVNLVNTNNNGPGEINPIWISNQSKREYYKSIEVYEDYIYAAGFSYDTENETHSAIIGKYDPNDGSQIWMKNWSYYSDTEAWSIDVYDNAIYVIGYTTNFKFVLYEMTDLDSFICKFDLNGSLVWSKIINESAFDKAGGIKVYDDFVYVCGLKDFTSWLLKYDTNGKKLWSKIYEIPNTVFSDFYDLDIYDGYVYAEGLTWYGIPPFFNQDLLVVKFDLDGSLQWYKKWGGKGFQSGTRMDIGDDGFIYIPGFDFEDYHWNDFTCKFNLNGKIKWVATTSIESVLNDVVFWNGDVYVIGEDRTFDEELVWDVLLAKVDGQGNLIWYLNYKRSEGPQPYARGFTMDEYEDYFYLVGSNRGFGFIMKYDVTLYSDNNKPDTPSRPSGSTSGIPGVEYNYSTSTTDPDGDLISYCFSWGDNNVTITEWMNSGETVTASHSWSERGKYNIRVRGRDECGFVSEWSDPLSVTMPRNKAYINTPFLNFLQNHPFLYQLLQLLLQRLGL